MKGLRGLWSGWGSHSAAQQQKAEDGPSTSGQVGEAQPKQPEAGWSRRAWPRATLRSCWPYLTLQQVEGFKEVFSIFDSDNKGFFTKDELYAVMKAMGGDPSAEELQGVMYELDADGNQAVGFPEFLCKFMGALEEQQILEVFEQLAINEAVQEKPPPQQQQGQEGEGADEEGGQQAAENAASSKKTLSLTALEKCFAYVGDPVSEADMKYLRWMFQNADTDRSGRLSLGEFLTYLEKLEDELGGGAGRMSLDGGALAGLASLGLGLIGQGHAGGGGSGPFRHSHSRELHTLPTGYRHSHSQNLHAAAGGGVHHSASHAVHSGAAREAGSSSWMHGEPLQEEGDRAFFSQRTSGFLQKLVMGRASGHKDSNSAMTDSRRRRSRAPPSTLESQPSTSGAGPSGSVEQHGTPSNPNQLQPPSPGSYRPGPGDLRQQNSGGRRPRSSPSVPHLGPTPTRGGGTTGGGHSMLELTGLGTRRDGGAGSGEAFPRSELGPSTSSAHAVSPVAGRGSRSHLATETSASGGTGPGRPSAGFHPHPQPHLPPHLQHQPSYQNATSAGTSSAGGSMRVAGGLPTSQQPSSLRGTPARPPLPASQSGGSYGRPQQSSARQQLPPQQQQQQQQHVSPGHVALTVHSPAQERQLPPSSATSAGAPGGRHHQLQQHPPQQGEITAADEVEVHVDVLALQQQRRQQQQQQRQHAVPSGRMDPGPSGLSSGPGRPSPPAAAATSAAGPSSPFAAHQPSLQAQALQQSGAWLGLLPGRRPQQQEQEPRGEGRPGQGGDGAVT